MKRLRQLLDVPAEDRGAALILVLFIVTVIGLAGAALLTFSDTSIRTTVALRDQAGNAYNADGAAQVAIENLSTGPGFTSPALFDNANDTTCFGPNTWSGTLNLPDFYPAVNGRNESAPSSASIVCTADPATGVNATVVPINPDNRPGQAILTLGKTTEVGINIEAPLASPFAVKGPVRSNSTIKVLTGTLQSTAAVTAVGACTGTIVSTPTKSCSLAANAVSDPGYASEATAVPAYQPVPLDDLTSCPSGVVTFLPGYYDDAKALTALMDSTGACAGSTWWFKSGTYYFDFHNNTKDPDVYRGAVSASGPTANRWEITTGNLVAGTPTDSNGTAIASPGDSPTIPGSCQNPGKLKTATGVQFIFGGDSQLALGGSANAEICGTYHADRPPIALYGLSSGAATTTTLSQTAGSALKMSTVLSPENFTNATEASLAELDGSSATWPKTSTATETSTITMSGFAPPPATPIPPGSIVKSATVLVTHGNSKKYVAADKLAVTFTPKGVAGSPPGPDITPAGLTYPNNANLKTDKLVVQAASATSPFGQYVHENGFTGADITHAATLTHAGTESLDTIQINITYVAPAFRSENIATITSNCMKPTYTRTSTTACAVLSTSIAALSSFTGAFYIQGTTYTPIAAIDLTLSKTAQQVLRFGVITRSLWTKQTGPFSYSGPVIEMPDDTTGGNRAPIVFFTVYVCPAITTSTCSTDPARITALRVKAMIDDSTPPRRMTILSWSNLR